MYFKQHNTPHQVKYKHCAILEILLNVVLLPKEMSSESLQNQGERCKWRVQEKTELLL